jgi:hypothetical protein
VSPWIKILCLVVATAIGFGGGYYIAHLSGVRNLSDATGAWDKERAELSSQRADAINARLIAEQKQAAAINEAAANYEKGRADAEASNAAVVDGLRNGTLRLQDQWATCRATAAAVSSAAGGYQPDDQADDRAASAGRIVRAAAQCDAQVIGLQQALMGERE